MSKESSKKLKKSFALGGFITVLVIAFIEPALASLDMSPGIAAATKPLLDGIEAHWGKSMILASCGGLLFGKGDLDRTK